MITNMKASVNPFKEVSGFMQMRPQFASFAILLVGVTISYALRPLFIQENIQIQYLIMSIVVGGMACFFSTIFHLPIWWIRMNTCFPFLVFIFYSLHIPSWIYGVFFLILLSVYWTTFVTRVPYYPSTMYVWEKVETLLPQEGNFKVLEIGSGLGGFCRVLSKRYPNATFIGLENAPIPWCISWVMGKIQHAPCILMRKNYQQVDFSEFDVIYAFLSPAVMDSLCQQAKKQLKPGAIIVSYMFEWPKKERRNVRRLTLNNEEFLHIYQPTLKRIETKA